MPLAGETCYAERDSVPIPCSNVGRMSTPRISPMKLKVGPSRGVRDDSNHGSIGVRAIGEGPAGTVRTIQTRFLSSARSFALGGITLAPQTLRGALLRRGQGRNLARAERSAGVELRAAFLPV